MTLFLLLDHLRLEIGDAVLGAGVYARAAVGAEARSDVSAEVRNFHRALLARLLALFTADTARCTQLAG